MTEIVNTRRAQYLIGLLLVALLLGGWSRSQRPPGPAFAPDLTLLGRLAFPDQHPVTELAVSGRYAYVAANDARFEGWGLRVVDLISPQQPTLIGSYNLPHTPGQTGQVPGLALSGSYVYLAAGRDGLRVINVSDPAHPAEVAAFNVRPSLYLWDVAVAGSYAYLAAEDGLYVVNISNPAAPVAVGSGVAGSPRLVTVAGSYAYLGIDDRLVIIDISDPAAPQQRGTLNIGVVEVISGIAVQNDVAYATFGYCLRTCIGGLATIDVSDPANPARLGTAAESFERPLTAVTVAGNSVFAGVDNGCSGITNLCSGRLLAIDVSDPTRPYVYAEEPFGQGPTGIAVSGDLVYVLDDSPSYSSVGGRISALRYVAPLPQRQYMPLLRK